MRDGLRVAVAVVGLAALMVATDVFLVLLL